MKIQYKKSFIKKYKKLDVKVKKYFQDTLEVFIESPENPQLRNHELEGKWKGKRSINVTGDIRAIFSDIGENFYEFIEFEEIGTHSQLYK